MGLRPAFVCAAGSFLALWSMGASARADEPPASAGFIVQDEDDWGVDRLRPALVRYAEADRAQRFAAGWILLGLGAGAIGGGTYWATQVDVSASAARVIGPLALISGGVVTSGIALMALLTPSLFEDLSRYYDSDVATGRSQPLVRKDVEALWANYANTEHRRRQKAGVALILTGSMLVCIGLSALFSQQSADHSGFAGATALLTPGLAFDLGGVFVLLEPEGPIESRWHAYQNSSEDWGSPGK